MSYKPKVYLTSNVFTPEEISSNEKISQDVRDKIKSTWKKLNSLSTLKYFKGRFPKEAEIKAAINDFNPNIIGCHLSHPISSDSLKKNDIFAVATATAGYNHIQRPEKDDILITHTPGVLQETVADYTIALIMANLRNIVDLHNYVWEGKWTPEEKWDLDQSLSSVVNNKILGIVGLGEIGTEIVKRLYSWGIKIVYYDIRQIIEFEEKYPKIEFKKNIQDVFKEADIVSLHIPLNKFTEKIINRNLLKLMKKDALLINTARGPILDLDALLELLEKKEIRINLCFDVYPVEPIDTKTLQRLKKIKKEQPEIKMIMMPHNASADADTRGNMVVMFLEDIIKLIESSSVEDLTNIHIIPEQKSQLLTKKWKIENYWKFKK